MAIHKPHSPGFPLYNKNHPLARGLVFGAIPGGMHRQDIVSGNFPTRDIGTGNFSTRSSKVGRVWESNSTTAGGLSWPITPEVKTLADTNAATIVAWAEVDSDASFKALLGVPYRDTGAWTIPWLTIVLNENSGAGDASFNKGYSPTQRYVAVTSVGNYFPAPPQPMVMHAVTNDKAEVDFYREGKFFQNLNIGGSLTYDFSSAVEISMAYRASNPTGEGYDGGVGPGFMWNRALSASEIAQIYADPFIFIRPSQPLFAGVSLAPAFEVSLSSNIAAGGEATTAQLTAPSGKTTGDFDAGRVWDDENGSDSIDITSGNYTELEWCLQATVDSEEVSYDFRVVLNDGTVLDTYTVTPQLTVSAVEDQEFAESFSVSDALTLDVDQALAESFSISDAFTLDIDQGLTESIIFSSIGTDIIDEEFTTPAGWTESGTVTQTGGDATATSSTTAGATLTETFTAGSEFWAEVDVSLDSGFVITNNGHSSHMCALIDSSLRLCALTALKSGDDIVFRANYQGDGSSVNVPITTPASITLGQMYRVRMHVKQNSGVDVADGVREMWLDGVKVLDVSDVDDDTRQVDGFRIGNITPSSTVNGTSRFDNAKVGTTIQSGEALTLDIDQALAESVSISDAFTLDIDQALAESVSISDALGLSFAEDFAESVSIADAWTLDISKEINESVNSIETFTLDVDQGLNESVFLLGTDVGTDIVTEDFSAGSIPVGWSSLGGDTYENGQLVVDISAGAEGAEFVDSSTHTELWAEFDWTIGLDVDVPGSDHARGPGIFLGSGSGNPRLYLGLLSTGGVPKFRYITRNDGGNQQADLLQLPVIGKTYKVVLHWKAATAPAADDGIAQIWLNGNLELDLSNIDSDTLDADNLLLGNNSSSGSPTGTWFFDNVSMGTTGSAPTIDVLTKDISKALAESVSISDALGLSYAEDFAESVSISDAFTLDIDQALAESVSVSEAFDKNISQALAESITIGDSFATELSTLFAESFSVSDALTLDIDQALVESVSITEALAKDISQALAETITISEELETALSLGFAESVSISDAFTLDITQELAENLSIVDALSKNISQPQSETISISDAFETPIAKNWPESVSLSESLTLSISKALSETVNVAEELAKNISKPLAETISIAEAITVPIQKNWMEPVVISEGLVFVISQSLSESINVGEAFQATSTIFDVSPLRVLLVGEETRSLSVSAETRTILIPEETRSLTT
jgi:hypothetical protein